MELYKVPSFVPERVSISYQEIKEVTKLKLLGSCFLFYIDAACVHRWVYLSELEANFDCVSYLFETC